MENETIERVARAIAEEQMGPGYDWTCFVGEARAAIAAMRKLSVDWEVYDVATQGNSMHFEEGWEAVIDAILKSE